MIRASERVYLAYYTYVVIIALVMRRAIAGEAALILAGVLAVMLIVARFDREHRAFTIARDWLPLVYTILAYREMNLFTPAVRDYHLERAWIGWDRWLLTEWNLRGAIESLGVLIPGYLEFCYLLVYGTGAIAIGAFYAMKRPERVDRFLVVYAVGTLLSYALFPYFPSDPPRVVFAGSDVPGISTALREFNLYLVGNYGIHSSVFPSAHVSSAFAAAWGLLFLLPETRWVGWLMLIYAVSVSIATVYGRYHYATDAVAGAGVGLVAFIVALALRAK